MFAGVPQRFMLGPLMFNVCINDIFIFPNTVCLSNYADDTTLNSMAENHNTNKKILNKKLLLLQKWFYDNFMVLNPDKCCYMSLVSNPGKSDLILKDSTKIHGAEEVVVLGVTIDNKQTFYNHLKKIC